MKFTLTIELGNAAMNTSTDISDALKGVIADIDILPFHEGFPKVGYFDDITDANGNPVGIWEVKP